MLSLRSLFGSAVVMLGLALGSPVYAQITTQPLTQTSFCAGDTIVVNFTSSNTFQMRNAFTAQLSDASGSFSQFVNIGTRIDSLPGPITAVIPNVSGSHFRIRVFSALPYIAGSDNGTDLTIWSRPDPQIYVFHDSSVYTDSAAMARQNGIFMLLGDQIDYEAADPGMASYSWHMGPDATPSSAAGKSTGLISFASTGQKTITLTVTNQGGCSSTGSRTLAVLSCNPMIPPNAIVVSSDTFLRPRTNDPHTYWVNPGLHVTYNSGAYDTLFVESGAYIDRNINSLIYLKPGAVLGDNLGGIILRSPDAQIQRELGREGTCQDLTFDYATAPPNKIMFPDAGVEEASEASALSAYPNPATKSVTLHCQEVPKQVRIYDAAGAMLESFGNITTAEPTFDLTKYSAASYTFVTTDTKGEHRTRVVVQ